MSLLRCFASKTVKLQTQDVCLRELEWQFKIKQLEIEAKDREEGRKLEMERSQLVHKEKMKELELRSKSEIDIANSQCLFLLDFGRSRCW